jgi:hypothetical protein
MERKCAENALLLVVSKRAHSESIHAGTRSKLVSQQVNEEANIWSCVNALNAAGMENEITRDGPNPS